MACLRVPIGCQLRAGRCGFREIYETSADFGMPVAVQRLIRRAIMVL